MLSSYSSTFTMVPAIFVLVWYLMIVLPTVVIADIYDVKGQDGALSDTDLGRIRTETSTVKYYVKGTFNKHPKKVRMRRSRTQDGKYFAKCVRACVRVRLRVRV